MQVHDGVVPVVVQPEDREPDPVQVGRMTAAAAQPWRSEARPGLPPLVAVSKLSHGSGRSLAGGAVMPWPLTFSPAHNVASWPGTGLSRDTAPHACSAATKSPSPPASHVSASGVEADGGSMSLPGGPGRREQRTGARGPGHGTAQFRLGQEAQVGSPRVHGPSSRCCWGKESPTSPAWPMHRTGSTIRSSSPAAGSPTCAMPYGVLETGPALPQREHQ